MRIINVNGNNFVDQELYNYIKNIWITYDQQIANDSCIYFAKNTTINRLITDYTGKNISRVIKREKADYVIIDRFNINEYPQFYDGINTTDDHTKEVVYAIYNNSMEVQDTIELILDFIVRGQDVKYVNQDKLNESLNNGFILDKENYIISKQLIDSEYPENHKLAAQMLIASDLKSNWQWILYLYYKCPDKLLAYDSKQIIPNYINTLGLGRNFRDLTLNIDSTLKVITDKDIINRYACTIKDGFMTRIEQFFQKELGTSSFQLDDFKISLKNKNK